jgi:3-oxoacyl-[acyl-carrier-protein] synthase II
MNNNFKTINRLSMLQVLTNIPSATLNVKYQFEGPSLCVSSACATGLSAIIEGFKWIKLN